MLKQTTKWTRLAEDGGKLRWQQMLLRSLPKVLLTGEEVTSTMAFNEATRSAL